MIVTRKNAYVGMWVKKGPHFNWVDEGQHYCLYGRIHKLESKFEWAGVKWFNERVRRMENTYRIGYKDSYDLETIFKIEKQII